MADKKLFGRVLSVVIQGRSYDPFPGGTINPGGVSRETVVTNNGARFVEKIMQAKLDIELPFGAGDSKNDYVGAGLSIQVNCDSGQTFIMADAWSTDVPDIAEGGKLKVVYESAPAQEML
ncbi:hypothetical protein MMA231_00977 [Asticcacaulis sp. MM231]|uniref:phage tail tube protein n=1 Tax=Asticcacaulis sp. MM231 TaxID=3157666 RepID=UPI0032D5873C